MASQVPRFLAIHSSLPCCVAMRTKPGLINFRMKGGHDAINKAYCSFERTVKPALAFNKAAMCKVVTNSGSKSQVVKNYPVISAVFETDILSSDVRLCRTVKLRRKCTQSGILSGYFMASSSKFHSILALRNFTTNLHNDKFTTNLHYNYHSDTDRGNDVDCVSPSVLLLKTGSRILSGQHSSTGLRMFTTDSNNKNMNPSENENNSNVNSSKNSEKTAKPKKKGKSEKSVAKEFKLKNSIGSHDLGIKLNQMKALLDKGKTIHIILRVASGSETFQKDATTFNKKISSDLEGLCKIQQEYCNKTAAKFILTPVVKEEAEVS